MKNKILLIISIIILTTVIVIIFLYMKSPKYILNNDIKNFNTLNSQNIDINICNQINNTQIKEKCIDNYYSILAFNKLDISICEKIISNELKEACKKEILKFN
jgi:flagellar biosynthesis/type III secretory pathway M-ring protein FliF/YscJ